ncbi:MAG TPA: DUF3786 domain-containing protein [Candidatus Limivivens intestinipullorum]|uniref:DUF3786 domain-containing protein n=1 Tax=Candidatus Limivivens intestinipullorum TaxID=2840858 RepID=A0A9D1ER41_9FIRM|nr:DUF3786 domain-containing protein [Candidatus Limivivens intestinipullorum]
MNNKTENRAFLEMRKAALNRLEGKAPEPIAARTGIFYDKERKIFTLKSMGYDIEVSYPQFHITPELNEWHQLLLLHYMDMADSAPLTGQLMSFGDLPGGMVRGGGFDRQSERALSQRLGNASPALVKKACEDLGAEIFDSNADLSGVFSVFPYYPITLKLWFADEDIPGSGKLLLDKSANRFLSVEDAVTAGSLLLDALFSSL